MFVSRLHQLTNELHVIIVRKEGTSDLVTDLGMSKLGHLPTWVSKFDFSECVQGILGG